MIWKEKCEDGGCPELTSNPVLIGMSNGSEESLPGRSDVYTDRKLIGGSYIDRKTGERTSQREEEFVQRKVQQHLKSRPF